LARTHATKAVLGKRYVKISCLPSGHERWVT
jgi:hypothetical protein